jgi:hypothetical protein
LASPLCGVLFRGMLFFTDSDLLLIHQGIEANWNWLRSRKLGGKPASREVSVPLQSSERDVKGVRGLGQPSEEAQLDDFGGARVKRFEPR